MAYELIKLGLRLRDLPSPDLTYVDLAAIVRQSPPDSAIARATQPLAAHSNESEFLRSIEYSMRWLVWAKTKDGSKGRNMPEPITFPWEESQSTQLFAADVMTTDEADAFLGW